MRWVGKGHHANFTPTWRKNSPFVLSLSKHMMG
jgi:hypothetical protein